MKNLLELTAGPAYEEMIRSTHDLPFQYGPYGEGFCCTAGMWVGSLGKLDPIPEADPELVKQMAPLPNEPFVTLDWSLPLTAEGQTLLFRRIKQTFYRVTGMVPLHQKRKYRMNADELNRNRNLVSVFSQIQGHLRARLGDAEADKWVADVESGVSRDEDLLNLMQLRPPLFSLSMLLSQQRRAKTDLQEVELKRVEKVESQRQEVLSAQWNYFVTNLEADYAAMERVHAAPQQVRQRLHVKQVSNQAKHVALAEQACTGYQDRRFLCFFVIATQVVPQICRRVIPDFP